jgi:hypothetical protein
MDTNSPQSFDAIYDGSVLRPEVDLNLPANTRVRVTVEPVVAKKGEPYSSFKLALSMNLDGPADASEKLDEYLYGGRDLPE